MTYNRDFCNGDKNLKRKRKLLFKFPFLTENNLNEACKMKNRLILHWKLFNTRGFNGFHFNTCIGIFLLKQTDP